MRPARPGLPRHPSPRATSARTTLGELDSQSAPKAKVAEAINLISGLVPLGGRMLLQLAQSLNRSEDSRIMGERIAYRS